MKYLVGYMKYPKAKNEKSHWHNMKYLVVYIKYSEVRNEISGGICEKSRSYQCPPYSCWIPVIPAESGGVEFGRKAC